MTAPEPAAGLVLVVLDQETPDHDLTVRSHIFHPDRLVLAIGWGDPEDEENGGSVAVALDRADLQKIRDTLSAWLGGDR